MGVLTTLWFVVVVPLVTVPLLVASLVVGYLGALVVVDVSNSLRN